MKLRAPRCKDGRLATSLSASRCQPACPPSFAKDPLAPASNATAPMREANLMGMVGHSIWNGAVAVPLGDEEERDEKSEIQRREDARHQHIDAVGRLEAEPHEHQEGDEDDAEQDLRSEAAITDRLVLRAVERRHD